MKNNKLTSGQSLSTVDHGNWPLDFNNKNKLKQNLVTSLFDSLRSTNRFIQAVSVGLLVLPSQNRNWHGQHGHGGAMFTKLKKMLGDNNLVRKSGLVHNWNECHLDLREAAADQDFGIGLTCTLLRQSYFWHVGCDNVVYQSSKWRQRPIALGF
jgi:hypothetical protein